MSKNTYKLSQEQKTWAKRKRQGVKSKELESILIRQKGRCKLSGVPMIFDLRLRTPSKGRGGGCHPLSPAVDHIDCGNVKGGFQIVCYALNDVKGHLPLQCYKALKRTQAWNDLMEDWRRRAEETSDPVVFRRLLRPNA
jgi:hypothetical protein